MPERDIVWWGNSLGGAVASGPRRPRRSAWAGTGDTFSSLADLTEWHYGRLARILVTGTLDSRSKIGGYAGPLLQSHGNADTIVPFELGKRLFDAAKQPKRFVEIPGGDHNDLPTREYLIALEQFLEALSAPAGKRPLK